MAHNTAAQTTGQGSSALEREANHVNGLVNGQQPGKTSKEAKEDANGLNNPVQVEQDNRVEKAKADAIAAGGGPDMPEDGPNQDG